MTGKCEANLLNPLNLLLATRVYALLLSPSQPPGAPDQDRSPSEATGRHLCPWYI